MLDNSCGWCYNNKQIQALKSGGINALLLYFPGASGYIYEVAHIMFCRNRTGRQSRVNS